MSVRAEILQFLRAPRQFAETVRPGDGDVWRQGLNEFAQPQIAEKGDYALRVSQVAAWNGLADHRAGLIQGPPGTGKTYVLSWMALGYLQARRAAGLPCRILVTAFTLNAIGNLLDAIQAKVTRYLPAPPDILYLGSAPAGGLDPSIRHISFRNRDAVKQIWENLDSDYVIAGCSVWALNRVLNAGGGDKPDGPTSPLFQLVCIDEASQMVISNGLMALAGLGEGGRVLVAGDDKQLPPVRAVHALEIDGRRLGGSLYDFLKSAEVAEFPLEETFRLNAPLTRFPETKFYPGRYRSAAASAGNCLELRDGWDQGLESWERAALDPRYPLCVLLHDGPTSGTSNPFEVAIASRLVRRLYRAMQSETADDSIDKLKRLHSDYQDAEEAKGLASLRTRLFDDDPGANHPRRECCGQPATCDRFRQGECWFFAATDQDQITARGRYRPGNILAVADRPVFSGTSGNVEDLIRRSDVVFTTFSLEVGYDDPDMALVFQHYAPKNLASFIQRKGRGGRGVDDRPVTGVTLSPYSPRDSWYYHRPHQMLDSTHFEVPLNVDNYFVRRGQVLATLLDAFAHHRSSCGVSGLVSQGGKLVVGEQALSEADQLVCSIFGNSIYRELGYSDLAALWQSAAGLVSTRFSPETPIRELRATLPWIPQTLFGTVNLPALAVHFENESGAERSQTFPRELPEEARAEVGTDIHPNICLPGAVTLEVACKILGEDVAPRLSRGDGGNPPAPEQ